MRVPGVKRRIWLPLLIISEEGRFVGKTRLQKIVFLVQYEARLDLYDFKKCHYGPYSRELDLDIVSNEDLIRIEAYPSIYAFPEKRYYFVFEVTEKAKQILKAVNPNLVMNVKRSLDKYIKAPLPELLDYVYDRFVVEDFDDRMEHLGINLTTLHRYVKRIFKVYGNRQALFALMVIDYLKEAHEALKRVNDPVQRGVVLNLAEELCEALMEIVDCLKPPIDSYHLRRRFMDIAETWNYLIEYCDKRGLIEDPFKQLLELSLIHI